MKTAIFIYCCGYCCYCCCFSPYCYKFIKFSLHISLWDNARDWLHFEMTDDVVIWWDSAYGIFCTGAKAVLALCYCWCYCFIDVMVSSFSCWAKSTGYIEWIIYSPNLFCLVVRRPMYLIVCGPSVDINWIELMIFFNLK